jgi:hypothetical protein
LHMRRDDILKDLPNRAGQAVAHYWKTRTAQRNRQQQTGKADQGLRSAVTGGAQMDGFINLFTELIFAAGIPGDCVHRSKDVELPGFFRPTDESNNPVKVREPHFKVFREFVGASYRRRYEIFCRKLVLERHYTASAFVTSTAADGTKGVFSTPADDISLERFGRTLVGHLAAFV